jgi:protein SCO1/2
MRLRGFAISMLVLTGNLPAITSQAGTTNYVVRGILKEIRKDEHQLVIAHDAIPNFMEAMTMPFNVKDVAILTNVTPGADISFQLHVTESESWVDHVERNDVSRSAAGKSSDLVKTELPHDAQTNSAAPGHAKNPLRNFKFTNELGQPVSLSDFDGQAIALTFFFTRCPIPEFCPRLSRNFQEVQRKLTAMENAPTNWHLLSVTFDPAHDTPEALKAYGVNYQYDPAHWSFLTGPQDKIAELARLCDVKFEPDNSFFNHNFRTLIINASNQLQMIFPTSGDISKSIAQELLKAAIPSGTNLTQVPHTEESR